MATLEERIARVEQENAELKKSVELLNIALGALVNKATLEKVNEQNGKIFETLTRHDQLTNQQLAELRGQLTEQDGKIVGLQTKMRQEFAEVRTEMRQEFAEVKQDVGSIYARFNDLEKLLIDRLPPGQ